MRGTFQKEPLVDGAIREIHGSLSMKHEGLPLPSIDSALLVDEFGLRGLPSFKMLGFRHKGAQRVIGPLDLDIEHGHSHSLESLGDILLQVDRLVQRHSLLSLIHGLHVFPLGKFPTAILSHHWNIIIYSFDRTCHRVIPSAHSPNCDLSY